MKQLKLSEKNLLKIGFVKKEYEAIEQAVEEYGSVAKETYQIPTINGFFIYNCNEEKYVWYHKTIINNGANFALLDITHKATLFTLLSAFRVKFKIAIND